MRSHRSLGVRGYSSCSMWCRCVGKVSVKERMARSSSTSALLPTRPEARDWEGKMSWEDGEWAATARCLLSLHSRKIASLYAAADARVSNST